MKKTLINALLSTLILSTCFGSVLAMEKNLSDTDIELWEGLFVDMSPQYSSPMCDLPFLKNRYVLYWEVDFEFPGTVLNIHDVDVYERQLGNDVWKLKEASVGNTEIKVKMSDLGKEYIVCREGTAICSEVIEDSYAGICD